MMSRKRTNRSDVYQTGISVAGMVLWVICAARITGYGWRDQLMFLAIVPAVMSLGRFVQHFRLPLGSKFTRERITFTLSDGIVLLVACSFGLAPAVLIAGIDGFTSSRRTARRLSSNFFRLR